MFSRTAEYALRAVVAIASGEDDRPVLAEQIARKSGIPRRYLSKILRDLVHAGILTSARGIGGGFRLRRRPDRLKIIEVIRPFEDMLAARRCPFGNPRCSDDKPCSIHHRWKPVKQAFEQLIEETTIADVIDSPSTI